jgi:hypothetical protein
MEYFDINHMEYLENICKSGDLESLKELHLEGKISKNDVLRIDEDGITLFEWVVAYGHFEICKYFYYTFQITKEDVSLNNYFIFDTACFMNHLNICVWLQKKFKFTKEELILNNNKLFKQICLDSPIEIITYLNKTFGFTMEDTHNFIHLISEKRKEELLECLTPIGSLIKPAK